MRRPKNNLNVEVIQNAMKEIMQRPELSLPAKARGIKALRRAQARVRRLNALVGSQVPSATFQETELGSVEPRFRS